MEKLYQDLFANVNDLLERHELLSVAACLVTTGMMIYKMALSPEDYDKMADLIHSKKDQVKRFPQPSNDVFH